MLKGEMKLGNRELVIGSTYSFGGSSMELV
jgi:hypothetical protein